MKNLGFIAVVFMLAGCAAHRPATVPPLTLGPLNYGMPQSDRYQSAVDFAGFSNRNYVFDVSIQNNSTDSIAVNPSLFFYRTATAKAGMGEGVVYGINPEEKVIILEIQKDSLMKQKNPYSTDDQSVKEMISESLIRGTIATLFGNDPGEWIEQRDEDEYHWESDRTNQLVYVQTELDFWNTETLLPRVVAPGGEMHGKVLFPVTAYAREIEVVIPVQDERLHYRFTQFER